MLSNQKEKLKEYLLNKNFDLQKNLNKDEFFSILNELNNDEKFNSDVANQFYEKLIKNYNNYISLENFIEIYLEGLKNIENKWIDFKKRIKNYKFNNDKIEENLKIKENLDVSYIDGEKILLSIKEIDLEDENPNFNIIYNEYNTNIDYNKFSEGDMEMNYDNTENDLKINVFEQFDNNFILEFNLNLKKYHNTKRNIIDLEIDDTQNNKVYINLEIQIVKNDEQYYKGNYSYNIDKINFYKEEIIEFNKIKKDLQNLFNKKIILNKDDLLESSYIIKKSKNSNINFDSKNSFNLSHINKNNKDDNLKYYNKEYKYKWNPLIARLFFIFIILSFFSLILSLYKNEFMILLISLIFICWYYFRDEIKIIITEIFLIIILIWDLIIHLVWLKYNLSLWRTKYSDNFYNLRKFIVVISIIQLLVKFLAIYYGFILSFLGFKIKIKNNLIN